MKKIFKASVVALGMLLCLPVGSVYAAENKVQYYENGGVYGYTSPDSDPETMAKIDKLMNDKLEQDLNNIPQSRGAILTTHTSSDSSMGKDSRNTNARSYTNAKAVWGYAVPGVVGQLDTAGSSKGAYEGPSTPSKILLNQSYSISGASLSVSIAAPPSATLSSNKSSGSWQSQPVSGSKIVTASYPTMRAKSGVAIFSVTFTDTADIYFGSTIYRPTSRVTLK